MESHSKRMKYLYFKEFVMEKRKSSISLLGMLITLGIVYGDIGTSPLYVMNSIIGNAGTMADAKPEYILGSVSLIF